MADDINWQGVLQQVFAKYGAQLRRPEVIFVGLDPVETSVVCDPSHLTADIFSSCR